MHPINEPNYRRGFNIAYVKPESAVAYIDVLPPATSPYDIVVCRGSPFHPPHPSFRGWSVNHRGNYWMLVVWQWPTPDALAIASAVRHGRDDISLQPHEWIMPPADKTRVSTMTLYELAGIAREWTKGSYRYGIKEHPLSFYAYALDGPYERDWTNESRGLEEFRAVVHTGDVIPPWSTMEDAWDAGIVRIKEEIGNITQ